MNKRCWVVEYTGKNQALFACPAGHTFRRGLLKKKRGIPLPGEDGLRFFARWWSKERGGVSMECPKCKKERN